MPIGFKVRDGTLNGTKSSTFTKLDSSGTNQTPSAPSRVKTFIHGLLGNDYNNAMWIICMIIVFLFILYLSFKPSKCACMPELNNLRDDLIDNINSRYTAIREEAEMRRAENAARKHTEEEEILEETFMLPSQSYKPQVLPNGIIHGNNSDDYKSTYNSSSYGGATVNGPLSYGGDGQQTSTLDPSGGEVTSIGELTGENFTVLDNTVLDDVQTGVLNLDSNEQWMMSGTV